MRRFAHLAALLAPLLLVACARPEVREPPPLAAETLRFSVEEVRVRARPDAAAADTFLDARRSRELLARTRSFLGERLEAVGGPGELRVDIVRTALVERRDAAREEPWNRLWRSSGTRLVATVAVRLSVTDELGRERAWLDVRVSRERVLGAVSLRERERAVLRLAEDLLRQLDSALREGVEERMSAYLALDDRRAP